MSFRETMTYSRVCVYQEVRRELSTGFLTLKLFAEHAKTHLPCMATPFPNSLLGFVQCAQDRTEEVPSQAPTIPAVGETEARSREARLGYTMRPCM